MSDIVGKTIEEANQSAKEQGKTIRIVRRDGEDCIVSMDHKPNRINVEVQGGKIIKILHVG